MASKSTDALKYKFIYLDKINVEKIGKLLYFDNFENIEINHYENAQPNRAKYVHFEVIDTNISPFVAHVGFCSVSHNIKIPLSVTHLKFSYGFNMSNIPHSVTHLTTCYLNHQTTACILPSVTHYTYTGMGNAWLLEYLPSITHLTSDGYFNHHQNLKISQTITHITFGDAFNESIYDSIPPSVTHLRFGKNFNQSLDNLPETVMQIELPERYDATIRKGLISKIIRR